MNVAARLAEITRDMSAGRITEAQDVKRRSQLLRVILIRNGQLRPGAPGRELLTTAMPRKREA